MLPVHKNPFDNQTYMRNDDKTSIPRLSRLIEEIVDTELRLEQRGLRFAVDELKVRGRLPGRVNIWATLHFLSKGSPFCCEDPNHHLWLFQEELKMIAQLVAQRLHIQQEIDLRIVKFYTLAHEGVTFDDEIQQRTPFDRENINMCDGLGRTALLRAVQREYTDQVQELLELGANISIEDCMGRSPFSLLKNGELDDTTASSTIAVMIENVASGKGPV